MSSLSTLDKAQLGVLSPISDGGQGVVYRVQGLQPRVNGKQVRLVYKEYKTGPRNGLSAAALEDLAAFRDSLSAGDRVRLVSRTAFPLHLVSQQGRISGFTMVQVPDQFFHAMKFRQGPDRTLGEVQHLLQSGTLLANRGLVLTDRLRLEFLLDVTETLDFFHKNNLVVGDLSAKNLLFRLSGKVRCFFLDCDSMILRGRSALPVIETPEWDMPGGEKPGTVYSDLYKLGLLVTRLFAGDQTTRDPAGARRLNAPLRRLVESDLTPNQGARSAAADWARPLTKAIASASAKPTVISSRRPQSTPAPQPPPMPLPTPAGSLATATTPSPPTPALSPASQRIRLRSGRKWTAILTAVTVAAGAAVILANSFHQASETSIAAAAALHTEAAALNRLLKGSSSSRSDLTRGIAKVQYCSNVPAGLREIRKAASRRSKEVKTASSLEVDALPAGTALQSDLMTALRASRRADKDYLSWARHSLRVGCFGHAPGTGAYSAGVAASKRATAAKRKFLRLWNPIAGQQGLPTRSEPQV